jgi:hypothetical protein
VLVVLPLAAVLGGNPLIFHLYGNGNFIPYDSPGVELIRFWDTWGREIVVGVVASAVLLARRVVPPVALATGLAAGIATLAWTFGVLFVALAMAGPGALN